jgi:AcrR family transcriptional regulator
MTANSEKEKKAVNALEKAFFRLLSENPADSISVQRVCDEAGYHRTTFYKYYKDVFGLYISFAEIVSKRIVHVLELALRGDPSCGKEIDALIEEYKKPFFSIVNARYAKRLHYIMSMVLEKRLGQFVSQSNRWVGGDVPTELLLRYSIGGFYELAFVWIENITRLSDQQFSRQVQDMLQNQIGRLFLPAPGAARQPAAAE